VAFRRDERAFIPRAECVRKIGAVLPGTSDAALSTPVKDEFGSGMCNITKCCTQARPEHIHITDNGITPLKERVVDRF
jgi:hypothetical protein